MKKGLWEKKIAAVPSQKFSLPKLRILRWGYLPELASICNAKLICNSLQHIKASNFSSVA
jgi:hypothetical protein